MHGSNRPVARRNTPRRAIVPCVGTLTLAVLLLLAAGGLLRAADGPGGGSGLVARTRQSLFGRATTAGPADRLDRQDPARSNLTDAPKPHRWWQPWQKPPRRNAQDFWSQDSTTH